MSLNDQLAQLWAAGQTLSEIERSTGIRRGVAIGHIYRARKAGDPRFQPRPPRPPVKARRLKPVNVGNRMPPPGRGLVLWLNVMTPYIPITSDGKEPDLAPFVGAIIQAAGKAVRKERGAGASDVSQKDVVFGPSGIATECVGQDNQGNHWTTSHWQGFTITTVEPRGR